MGLNDDGWSKVLAAKAEELEATGHFFIEAAELKQLSGREPRLMAKHDFSTAVPQPLRERGLGVIPVSRRRYLVAPINLFASFPTPAAAPPVKVAQFPPHIESLNFAAITSESVALNAAHLSGMFEDFLGSSPLHATVAGRMSTTRFSLRLGAHVVDVDNAQMEIDGGYESFEHLVLVEAKNHMADDFNIRQLYFPFRRFHGTMSKDVIVVYMVYSNGIFHLYRFDFPQADSPSSITLHSYARYALSASQIDTEVLLSTVRSADKGVEPQGIPFPQADSFDRLVNLLELLPLGKEDIHTHYDFDPRQADYYANAARYLGLAEFTPELQLTELGHKVLAQPERDGRNLALVRTLAQRPVFRAVIEKSLLSGAVPVDLSPFMHSLDLSPSTRARRASTVRAWAQWVLDLRTENVLF